MKYICLFLIALIFNINAYSQCPNGDAESGNFSSWNRYEGNNFEGTLNLSNFTVSTGNQQSVVTAGFDPIIGAALPTVIDGTYSFKVGDNVGNESASIMSYTFTVGGSGGANNFSFLYALVLEAPNHPANEQPFFSYWVSTSSNLVASMNPSNLIFQKKIISDPANSFFSISGSYVYKSWQTECIPALNPYIGQQVTIYFAAADCSPIPHPGAHMGYAYIDGLCKSNLPFPSLTGPTSVCNVDDPILFNGSATTNETDYYWKIQQTNASGTPTLFGISMSTPVVYNAPVSSINVGTTLTNAGYQIPNNAYFKVTLFVRNCNGGWTSTSQLFHTQFPNLVASNNTVICCGSSVSLSATISNPGFPVAYALSCYKWYNEAGNFLGNGVATTDFNGAHFSTLNVTPTKSTKYLIEFESNGCKNRKWIYVTTMANNNKGQRFPNFVFPLNFCAWPKYIKIEPNSSNYYFLNCNGTNNDIVDLAFHTNAAQASIQYLWNTGATTPGINMQANTQYQVTVTSPCGNNSYIITPRSFTGGFPTLSGPNACSETQIWQIYQVPLAANAVPAYNANKFRLRVYDRWGNKVYEQTGSTHTGFYNGQIQWDGRVSGAFPAQTTVFNYSVELWNCDNIDAASNVVKTGDITFVR